MTAPEQRDDTILTVVIRAILAKPGNAVTRSELRQLLPAGRVHRKPNGETRNGVTHRFGDVLRGLDRRGLIRRLGDDRILVLDRDGLRAALADHRNLWREVP